MRKLFCVFVVSVLFTACQDEILVKQEETRHVTDVNRQESIKENDGITYQDRKFFINSVDRQAYTLTRSIGESMLRRTFSVYAEKDGSYYLGVHIMPVGTTSKEVHSIQDVYVYVNSMLFGELSQSKLEWEFVTLKNNAPIRLKKGLNEITFMSAAPYYPEVDAIQVEADFSRLMFNDVLYDDYIKYLKASNSGSNEKIEQGIVDEELRRIEKPANTRSVINPSYSWQVTPSVLSNPDGNYVHKLNVPVTYTYHRKLSLAAGNYTFHTSAVESGLESSVDPIMCLYKIDDPHNYCFVNDDYTGMGLHSKVIANNLPAGDYYLVVRAYSSAYSSTTTGRQGLISVYQNNVLINTTCPVAGYSVDMTSPNTGALNFFTAYSTGIPEFFLEERNTKKVKFFGSTYFHMTDMDYMWFNDARMILNKPSNYVDYNMVITACGAFGAYYGNCDVYGNCVQVGPDITHDFPNLKQYDAIYSGTAETNNYNCAAWAGGITTSWVWSSSYGSAYVWSTWDNYFGNNPARYSGAVTYTREGAYAGNAEIAVWSKNNDISGVTHFSVRGTANNHPHGYAWESKPGGYRRMFHPMNSLNGDDYGSIIAYYRDISKDVNAMSIRGSNANQSLTFEESLEKGLTVIEKVELTDIEKRLLSPSTRSATDVSISIRNIKDLFSRWEASISTPKLRILSNPYVLVSTPEAIEFIDYCKNKKFSALVFFSELYFDQREKNSSEEISQLLFCKIFEEYATMIEEIKEEWKKNPYDKNGAYIAPLPETFIKKYLKALINKL